MCGGTLQDASPAAASCARCVGGSPVREDQDLGGDQ